MPKTADEKIDHLERKLNLYRVLVTLMVVLLLIIQRDWVKARLDGVESWFKSVQTATVQPS